MRFGLSDDQVELKATVRKFLEAQLPLVAVRTTVESEVGFDRQVWARMAQELGLHSIGSPEEYGGTGDSLLDQTVVVEELGRALDPSPFLPSIVLVSRALVEAGGAPDWLESLISGEVIASLALLEGSGTWGSLELATTARPSSSGWAVTGDKRFVLHGHLVDSFLVSADSAEGPVLLRVDRDAAGVTCRPLKTLDLTRPLSDVSFADSPAVLVGAPGQGRDILGHVLARAGVALAAEQVGGAERALEMATAYARERVQFGRPIGSFQSIKHLLADVLLELESARSAVQYAAWAFDTRQPDAVELSHVCQAVASEAFVKAAKASIQVHGAIGFTWEHDAHLFFKRASGSHQLLGTPVEHREALAVGLLGAPERRGSVSGAAEPGALH